MIIRNQNIKNKKPTIKYLRCPGSRIVHELDCVVCDFVFIFYSITVSYIYPAFVRQTSSMPKHRRHLYKPRVTRSAKAAKAAYNAIRTAKKCIDPEWKLNESQAEIIRTVAKDQQTKDAICRTWTLPRRRGATTSVCLSVMAIAYHSRQPSLTIGVLCPYTRFSEEICQSVKYMSKGLLVINELKRDFIQLANRYGSTIDIHFTTHNNLRIHTRGRSIKNLHWDVVFIDNSPFVPVGRIQEILSVVPKVHLFASG